MEYLKFILLTYLLLSGISLLAQENNNSSDSVSLLQTIESLQNAEQDSLVQDSIRENQADEKYSEIFYDWAAYGGYQYMLAPHPEVDQPAASFLLGFQYRKVFFEASLVENEGTYSFPIIFPNEFTLDYMYLQGLVGLQLHNARYLETSIMASFGHGDILWESAENGRDLFRDKFNLLKAGIRTEFTPKKFVSLFSTLGYQTMLGLELERVSQQQMSGFYISLGLKFGYYKMSEL